MASCRRSGLRHGGATRAAIGRRPAVAGLPLHTLPRAAARPTLLPRTELPVSQADSNSDDSSGDSSSDEESSSSDDSEDVAPAAKPAGVKPAAKAAEEKAASSSEEDDSSSSSSSSSSDEDDSSSSSSSSGDEGDSSDEEESSSEEDASSEEVGRKAKGSAGSSSQDGSSSSIPNKAAAPAKKQRIDLGTSSAGAPATVFVGNLPWSATEGELRDFFDGCGEIIDVRVGGRGGLGQFEKRRCLGCALSGKSYPLLRAVAARPIALRGAAVASKRRHGVLQAPIPIPHPSPNDRQPPTRTPAARAASATSSLPRRKAPPRRRS